jgi:predicted MFS family arabinose efflux permease
MPMIAANINADYSDMGTALASRGAGYLAANILGVILQNIVKKHSDGILICAFILPAIVVFVTPFVKSLILLSILFFIHGIAHGLTDLGKSIIFKI